MSKINIEQIFESRKVYIFENFNEGDYIEEFFNLFKKKKKPLVKYDDSYGPKMNEKAQNKALKEYTEIIEKISKILKRELLGCELINNYKIENTDYVDAHIKAYSCDIISIAKNYPILQAKCKGSVIENQTFREVNKNVLKNIIDVIFFDKLVDLGFEEYDDTTYVYKKNRRFIITIDSYTDTISAVLVLPCDKPVITESNKHEF